MKIRARILLSFFWYAVGTQPGFGQSIMQLGVGGGLAVPAADYGGTTFGYYAGTSYGLPAGYNIHIKSRFVLVGIPMSGEIDFSVMNGNGEAAPGIGKIDQTQRVFSIKAGPEFTFSIPSLPFTPYFGGSIAINDIGGDVSFHGVPNVSDAAYIMNAVSRVGVGLSAGALVPLNPRITLDVGISYNFLNPFSKGWEDVHPSVDQRVDSYLSLNDDKDPLYTPNDNTHFIGRTRNVHLMIVSVTFMFGI